MVHLHLEAIFPFAKPESQTHADLYSEGTGYSGHKVKLTIHLHLASGTSIP
jgi:hypothetical protein